MEASSSNGQTSSDKLTRIIKKHDLGTQTEDSPSQTSPNKRFKRENQIAPIGIAYIASPTKSPTKSPKKRKPQTPQKNTLHKYFPSPKKNGTCQTENCRTEDCKRNLELAAFNVNGSPKPSVSGYVAIKLEPPTQNQDSSCFEFPPDEDIENCELPDEDKYTKMKNEMEVEVLKTPVKQVMGDEFPSDDDVENCQLPDSQQMFDDMKNEAERLRENQSQIELSQNTALNEANSFPVHILENIFCHLPIRKLCTEIKVVCKHWNEVVSRPNFIPWKKRYFQLKSGDQIVMKEVDNICSRENKTPSTLFIGVMRYMKDIFTHAESKKILPVIKMHSKYEWAVSLLSERAPDCLQNEVPYIGSVTAALCILCSQVEDILEILNLLTHSSSECSVINALECLYCVATFFYHFKTKFSVNPGFHYRVYYALYCFENGTRSGQMSQTCGGNGANESERIFTAEQLQIINHPLGPNQLVKIVAFAGTGKTFTLGEFAKKWSNKKFLNLCYNKSVQENAKRNFSGNVESSTIHKVAREAIGYKYNKNISLGISGYNFKDILHGNNTCQRANLAVKAINKFVVSADKLMTITHVPDGKWRRKEFVPFTDDEKLIIRDDATVIWEAMVDNKAKITHDVYLKIYQLTHPVIGNYDCIFIDEAQDMTAAMIDILLSQKCSKIFVGDPHQQIYAYNGAVNSLNRIQATHVYHLTQSFRFGPEIAYIASCALETMKQEYKKTIVGTLNEGKTTGEEIGQVAFLGRTNFQLIQAAAKFCDENSNKTAAFIGGLSSCRFDLLCDIYELFICPTGQRANTRNRFINSCKNFNELVTRAEDNEDFELLVRIRLVEQYTSRIPEIIRKIKQRCNHVPAETADVIFSTTHKAKGSEFDTVVLANDYIQGMVQNEVVFKFAHREDDESNILYVALTRAKHRLVMSECLIEMLLVSGERFEQFAWTKGTETMNQCNSRSCINCRNTLLETMNRNFILERQNVTLSSKFSISKGPLCFKCSTSSNLLITNYSRTWVQYHEAQENFRTSFYSLVGPLEGEEKTV